MEQHFEGFDAPAEEESRSARKREAQAIRKLAEDLADLGSQAFSRIEFKDEDVKEALKTARALRPRSDERRRQLQYTAKLLRGGEHEYLRRQLQGLGASATYDPNTLRLERVRAHLLHEGISAVNALCAVMPELDRNKLRNLVKKAKAEGDDPTIPHPAGRALFKFIKDGQHKYQAELPPELCTELKV